MRPPPLWLLALLAQLLSTAGARADGSFPEPRQILLPAGRPEQIILATNFGLIASEDTGETWQFSCEQPLSAYASQYLLGGQRIYALTGSGLVYSDDDSCTWAAAGSSEVLPYALAVDASDEKRVYALGVPRQDWQAGESIYVSDDGGLTFGQPLFTAPPRSALLSVLAAPGRPSRLFAAMFSTPENHPILLRSDDSGEHWNVAIDLAQSLGNNPFELLAIDAGDDDKLYARILGASAETLAISDDGGQSFSQSVSIAGKLKALLKLASGTVLVGGVAGTEAVAYRSTDGAQTFEPWLGAPHIHALAERSGKLYVAAEAFWDGYAIAESDDEGVSLRPLTGFDRVEGVKSCVAKVCADSCAYHADINLWPASVCASESAAGDGSHEEPLPSATVAEPPIAVSTAPPPLEGPSGGGCACHLIASRESYGWGLLLLAGAVLGAGRRARGATVPTGLAASWPKACDGARRP